MSKTKAKPKKGVGQGTGSKGWNRWQSSARKRKLQSHIKIKVKGLTNKFCFISLLCSKQNKIITAKKLCFHLGESIAFFTFKS